MKESFDDLFNVNPRYSTSVAFILGLLLIGNLTLAEQNMLGNWIILLGQTILTNASAQNVIQVRAGGNVININSKEIKCLYDPIIYDIKTIKEIIDKVYPNNNVDIDILSKAINSIQKEIDELKKNS